MRKRHWKKLYRTNLRMWLADRKPEINPLNLEPTTLWGDGGTPVRKQDFEGILGPTIMGWIGNIWKDDPDARTYNQANQKPYKENRAGHSPSG